MVLGALVDGTPMVSERAVDGVGCAVRKVVGMRARERVQPRAWEFLSRMVEWDM